MDDNPWKVDSIQAFYLIKCPECTFDTKKETLFQEHAFDQIELTKTPISLICQVLMAFFFGIYCYSL